MPLTNDDVQQIGSLFDQKLDQKIKSGLMQFWDEVLEPKMATKDELRELATKEELNELRAEMKRDNRDTRDYIAGKVSELRGDVIGPAKQLSKKIEITVEKLVKKGVFSADDKSAVENIPMFEQRM